jgi:EKC/KEOPS complex subunit LAGE3/PCC1
MADDAECWKYKYHFRVEYPETYAEMVRTTMEVDKEIRPHLIRRVYSVEGNEFVAFFEAKSCKDLRVSLTSFYDMLLLATRTINAFA